VNAGFVSVNCGCRNGLYVLVRAPSKDGERHTLACPRKDQELDAIHHLVAKDGAWHFEAAP
jgi:hypothetical protein